MKTALLILVSSTALLVLIGISGLLLLKRRGSNTVLLPGCGILIAVQLLVVTLVAAELILVTFLIVIWRS